MAISSQIQGIELEGTTGRRGDAEVEELDDVLATSEVAYIG